MKKAIPRKQRAAKPKPKLTAIGGNYPMGPHPWFRYRIGYLREKDRREVSKLKMAPG